MIISRGELLLVLAVMGGLWVYYLWPSTSPQHAQTLMEFCTVLQRQSEADEAQYNKDPGSWTSADQQRHDAGFKQYVEKCVVNGKGIAPSAM